MQHQAVDPPQRWYAWYLARIHTRCMAKTVVENMSWTRWRRRGVRSRTESILARRMGVVVGSRVWEGAGRRAWRWCLSQSAWAGNRSGPCAKHPTASKPGGERCRPVWIRPRNSSARDYGTWPPSWPRDNRLPCEGKSIFQWGFGWGSAGGGDCA